MSKESPITAFGWHEVPRNRSNIPSAAEANTIRTELTFDTIWPQTKLVQQAQAHVKALLPQETYNHSLRVYSYGLPLPLPFPPPPPPPPTAS